MIKTRWICTECLGHKNRCVIVSRNRDDDEPEDPDMRCPWESMGGQKDAKWKRVKNDIAE